MYDLLIKNSRRIYVFIVIKPFRRRRDCEVNAAVKILLLHADLQCTFLNILLQNSGDPMKLGL